MNCKVGQNIQQYQINLDKHYGTIYSARVIIKTIFIQFKNENNETKVFATDNISILNTNNRYGNYLFSNSNIMVICDSNCQIFSIMAIQQLPIIDNNIPQNIKHKYINSIEKQIKSNIDYKNYNVDKNLFFHFGLPSIFSKSMYIHKCGNFSHLQYYYNKNTFKFGMNLETYINDATYAIQNYLGTCFNQINLIDQRCNENINDPKTVTDCIFKYLSEVQ